MTAMRAGGNEFSRVLAVAASCLFGAAVVAQQIEHLNITQPGGFPGLPVMTGITRTTNGVKISWDGPSGFYQVLQKTNLSGQNWQPIGSPNPNRTATITTLHSNAFFRVSGPAPQYAGSAVCLECHANVHTTVMNTRHTRAFESLVQVQQEKNPSCLPCHTVGYGLPTGYNTNSSPATLRGVQCESCHGPAARHAANEMDLSVRPRRELAGEVCGGCHSVAQHPTFDEWKSSGHFAVVEDMSAVSRVDSCGRCHSGPARLALISGKSALTVTNDANVGITCAVCHDPHQTHVWTNVMTRIVYTNQLRQALTSTNDFYLSTSDNFTNKYNPNINLCAQCHNHRGASWTSTSRPPHHSPQYNMLLGTVGVLPDGVTSGPATHAGTKFISGGGGRQLLVTNQCVTCHMPASGNSSGPPHAKDIPHHTFAVDSYNACAECHGNAGNAKAFKDFVHGYIDDQIQLVKASLNTWAATKAPGSLYATYGTRAWEYTTPGDLSPGGSGPTTAEQALIPDNIKKARFNLYLVLYDGSYGTHNGPHALTLLDAAQNWVEQETKN